jgi:Na+/H+ antiporter NhaD/arsenite permease-like protein
VAKEYVAFIALPGSLYVVSGGILVTGDIRATPRNNTIILAIGGLLANLVGTTGASMLLIRPILRINRERHRTLHVVGFFTFIVSNCGGCLTPVGDPPLFLGFLRGLPLVAA